VKIGRNTGEKEKEMEGGAGEKVALFSLSLFSFYTLFPLPSLPASLFARPALFRRHRAPAKSISKAATGEFF
jgi:hypothetical protein